LQRNEALRDRGQCVAAYARRKRGGVQSAKGQNSNFEREETAMDGPKIHMDRRRWARKARFSYRARQVKVEEVR